MSVYIKTGNIVYNIFKKLNPDSYSSRKNMCLQKIQWFIDYAEIINNTAVVLVVAKQ